MKARVLVFPRREILDPQGKALKDALSRLGFDEVDEVRVGKSFEIELGVDDPQIAQERLREMCEKLLANPVIEDYSFMLLGEEGS